MHAWTSLVVVVVMITSFFHSTNGDTDIQTKLISDLLWNYHPSVPPTNGGPVEVRMGFGSSYFDFVDEPKQLAIVHGFSYRRWYDYRLKWNETDYAGTNRVTLDRKHIWVPDIEVKNSADAKEMVDAQVLVFSSGTVRLYISYQIEFLCHMNLQYFPYDSQSCDIKFGSWHYTSEHINLTASSYMGTNSSRVKTAKDFKITSLDVQRNERAFRFIYPYSFIDVTYTIGLQRMSSAYSAKLILPSVLTGFLVLATFLLPTASYEKITLCSILFLCLLVLITFVHTLIPSTGETVIGQLLVFVLFVDFFATIMAVVSYNLRSNGSSTPTGYGIMLEDKTGEGEEEDKPANIPPSRKLAWLRYIDLISFVIFTLIFIVGLAVILGQRE